MKLVIMLNFFDEKPDDLRACVRSLAPLQPDLLIAVSGRYANFPPGQRNDHGDQIVALIDGSQEIGYALEIHQHRNVWKGDEVEKRQYMLKQALDRSAPEDFLLVWDADYRLHRAPADIRGQLESPEVRAAEIGFFEGWHLPFGKFPGLTEPVGVHPARLLMRAERGLHMRNNHFHYWTVEGGKHHVLGDRDATIPALDLTSQVLVYHAVHDRESARRDAQRTYYERRDEGGLES